jgi:PAS domain S-box-containing protein
MLGQSQTMVYDWESRIEVWTTGMERLFGYAAAEAVGAVSWELLRCESPRSWPEIVQALRREERWAGEVRHRAKDGSARITQATWLVQPGLGGEPSALVVAVEDQTAARQADTPLRESEARFRHMADSAPALIWMSDDWGQVVFANRHYEHLFGRPVAVMLGQGWERDVLAEDLPGYREAFRDAFRARRTFRAEGRVRDRDGQVRWLRCEAVPRLDDAGAFLGYTGCAVDVTETRMAAEELERRVAVRTGELMAAEASLRQTSAVCIPASCSRSTVMICSSLNLDFLIRPPPMLADSIQTWRKSRGSGHGLATSSVWILGPVSS